jgi:XTP/dITP diphosphohydrolase
MTTLLIATRNAHKVGEIRAILGAQFQFLTLNDFPAAPKVVEDADTFAGNAAKKAAELARWVAGNSKLKTQNWISSWPTIRVWKWTR